VLPGLALISAGALLGGASLAQEALLGAGVGMIAARFMLVAMEHDGTAVGEVHKRRINAAWTLLGLTLGSIAYMLLR
jgi:hypothetical protein